ncbi:RNA polymerase sigma-70 factor, ECF subfamily [Marisediminitalea aggregata]|jgi:RNA polymerase sigma-70 factor (ECF subfamily)|uniref:RNA polymerase sigma-70 factor, ECF subfamily n=1 Tax=Marisediminitalea aggregata TaxID=634436 RepID=A0A1M5L1F2_9ALTE|nr:sigma-70 family RNA polymerase sigma factor [Marisediminitalea aggregata]MAP21284.1 RNA polymerase subunit sigma [Alteromonadaceae bacterium]MCP3865638.1 sigma-70 family RNA polymerase sigma factor [Aestuariibacter sp.]HBY38604.1 RNA polymerase subunit sigma [Alteromonas sp.]MAX44976.1 RNA polymerase subunit sigma [Alteromonadaceae bacterium]MCP4238170.1 sigma-70 family RNA polymerase sigma factor [Aestuariibacter sp.]|tara:strand:+ start:607 stop:1218 length:612 start_codon:yes stop_codon:yes gene_type:complete
MLVGIPLEHENSAIEPKECAVEMSQYLVQVAETRCKASFARIFGYFAPRLRSYALKQLGNEALAMELVQDTMSNVWQKAHLFNSEKGSPSTWIFTIARNIRFDMLRKVQNRKEDICADDLWPVLCEQTPDQNETSLDEQVTLEQIGHLFDELPEKQKVVIEAIYIDGKSQQEIADELAIPLGTVKSRTRLALQRLKGMLSEYD